MGCIQNNKKVQIEINENNIIDSPSKITESNEFDYSIINELYLKNMAHRLTLDLWVKIIDYLPYNEIKEIGKINKTFNRVVKQNEILIKFFKKRNSSCVGNKSVKSGIKSNTNKFLSFSVLRNSTIVSNVMSDSNNMILHHKNT
jgi:hypothetical protein